MTFFDGIIQHFSRFKEIMKLKIYNNIDFIKFKVSSFFVNFNNSISSSNSISFPDSISSSDSISSPDSILSFVQKFNGNDEDRMFKDVKDLIESKKMNISSKDTKGDTALEAAIKREKRELISNLFEEAVVFLEETGKDYNRNLEEYQEFLEKVFLLAVAQKYTFFLERLIKLGIDVNVKDPKGNTALHFAILNLDTTATLKLLKFGLDPNIKNNLGKKPFDLILLDSSYLDQRDFLNNIFRDHNLLIDQYIDKYIDRYFLINNRYFLINNQYFLINISVIFYNSIINLRKFNLAYFFELENSNSFKLLKVFISEETYNRVKCYLKLEYEIPLLKLVKEKDFDKITTLVNSGKIDQNNVYRDVYMEKNSPVFINFNLLSFAIELQNIDVIRNFLENDKTDIYREINGLRPLDLAIKSRNFLIVKLFFEKNPDIDVNKLNLQKSTLLHMAVQELSLAREVVVESKSSYFEDSKAPNDKCRTNADQRTDIKNIIKFLIEEKGAKTDIFDPHGKLALDYINENRQQDKHIRCLLEKKTLYSKIFDHGENVKLKVIFSKTKNEQNKFKLFIIKSSGISKIYFLISEKCDQNHDNVFLRLKVGKKETFFSFVISKTDTKSITSRLEDLQRKTLSKNTISFLELTSKNGHIENIDILDSEAEIKQIKQKMKPGKNYSM